MKIIVAPDSFKGSLSAAEAAKAVKRGIIKVVPSATVVEIPLADGGEGTVDVLVKATRGNILRVPTVTGPLGEEISSYYGMLGDCQTAVIEMAAASGLTLIGPEKRNPLKATTFGTGELIKAALAKECQEVIIGLGGSATVDAGAGMAQALGARLLDKKGREIGFGGRELLKLRRIDLSSLERLIKYVRFVAAYDVKNPLCGPVGAASVYAPQKGASASMVKVLGEALEHFAFVVREELGRDITDIPGGGAAGGLGAGCSVFLNAVLKQGADLIIKLVNLKQHLIGTSLVITGEGKMDGQTVQGKTPYAVAKMAWKCNVPVLGIAAILGDDFGQLYRNGFAALTSITREPTTVEESVNKARQLIQEATERAMQMIKLGRQMATDGTH